MFIIRALRYLWAAIFAASAVHVRQAYARPWDGG